MRIRGVIGNTLKAAVICACVYGFVKWESIKPQDDDIGDFARKICVDEIRARYDVSTVRAYGVNKTNNGYVVRASVTLARGTPAKVICLTNAHGGVRDITIDEG